MKQRGFTLIELMIVIGVMVILSVLGIAGFLNYNRSQIILTSAQDVATILNVARSRAQSQVKPSYASQSQCAEGNTLNGYAVKLNTGVDPKSYALYALCDSPSSAPANKLRGCVDIGNFSRINPIDKKYLPPDISFGELPKDTSTNCFMFKVLDGSATVGRITVKRGDDTSGKVIKVDDRGNITGV